MKKATAVILCLVLALPLFSFSAVASDNPRAGQYQTYARSSQTRYAIAEDGSLWSWGKNSWGQLGIGTNTEQEGTHRVMDNVLSVSASGYHDHVMALQSDGSLWGWGGTNYVGMIGDGTTEQRWAPVKIMDGVAAVEAAYDRTLALKTDGTLWAWGGGSAPLGFPGYTTQAVKTPTLVMDQVAAFSQDYSTIGALKTDGTLWLWGSLGQSYSDEPVQVMDGVADFLISSYSFQVSIAVLRTDGTLWTWGDNGYGQLGDGTRQDRADPVKVMDNVSHISTGSQHAVAVKDDGTLWAWGNNTNGAVGNGGGGDDHFTDSYGTTPLVAQTSPVQVMDHVAYAAAGGSDTAAVTTDGTLYVWGNYWGEGHSTPRTTPLKLLDHVVSLPWTNHAAIQTDGTLWELSYGTAKMFDGVRIPVSAVLPTASSDDLTALCSTPNLEVLYHDRPDAKQYTSRVYNIPAYLIVQPGEVNGSNYIKLRDLAQALSGTPVQFDVGWDPATGAVSITTGTPYTPVGGELSSVADVKNQAASTNTAPVLVDGVPVDLQAYTIQSNNYFKLRDLCRILNVRVIWNDGLITLRTAEPYSDD